MHHVSYSIFVNVSRKNCLLLMLALVHQILKKLDFNNLSFNAKGNKCLPEFSVVSSCELM